MNFAFSSIVVSPPTAQLGCDEIGVFALPIVHGAVSGPQLGSRHMQSPVFDEAGMPPVMPNIAIA